VAPFVELTVALVGLEATYEDGSGADADAKDSHITLRAEPSECMINDFGDRLECKVGKSGLYAISEGCHLTEKVQLHSQDCVPLLRTDKMRGSCTLTGGSSVLQGLIGKLALSDRSSYYPSPPRIWGSLPRLAREFAVEQTAVLIEHSSAQGTILSVQLLGVEAVGFIGDPGSFVRRFDL
jgi:hypothetical protein